MSCVFFIYYRDHKPTVLQEKDMNSALIYCASKTYFFSSSFGKGSEWYWSGNVMDMDPEQCDDTTEKCWKYTVSTAGYGVDTYTWGTQKTVVLACQAAGGVAGVTVTLTEVAADDAESCIAKN